MKEKLKKNINVIFIIIIFVVSLLLIRTCNSYDEIEHNNIELTQNLIASHDSIKALVFRGDSLAYEHAIFITDFNTLKTDNFALYTENLKFIQANKKLKRKVLMLTDMNIKLNGKGGKSNEADATQLNDTTFNFSIIYEHDIVLDGEYKVKIDSLNNMKGQFFLNSWNTHLDLTTSIVEDNSGIVYFNVYSKNQNIEVNTLTSIAFNQRNSKFYANMKRSGRFVFGPTMSIGIMLNPATLIPGMYLGIGVGITYKTKLKDFKKIIHR